MTTPMDALSPAWYAESMPPTETPALRTRGMDVAAYRAAYTRGWRYSSTSPTATLDHGDARGEPDAWYDGYHDAAAGRDKWSTPRGEA